MPSTNTTIRRFFSWWMQGLMSPLENLAPKVVSRIASKAKYAPTILSSNGANLVDLRGVVMRESDISKLKNFDGVYLLAPESKVMSRHISDAQRGLPLSRIAEEVLPFDASELFFASDSKEEHLYTIVRSELSSQIDTIEAHGLSILGVAFNNSAEPVFFNFPEEISLVSRSRSIKLWSSSALLFSLLPIAAIIFLSHLEEKKQSVLNDELAQLRQQLARTPSMIDGSLEAQLEIRDAANIRSTLTSVAQALTESAQLDQLILTIDELVLDASASSASQVQANLDGSGAFESSEFVTSISRNNNDALERFRLKLSLQGEP